MTIRGLTVTGAVGEAILATGSFSDGSISNLEISDNRVVGNDVEFGPTHDNDIEGNVIKDNLYDCGVTVPDHNPMALDTTGNCQPSVAADYRNVMAKNSITGNGVLGEVPECCLLTPKWRAPHMTTSSSTTTSPATTWPG